jgi:hypothetical protein
MCPEGVIEARPTGYLQVKGPKGRRAWFALWRDADGRHQKRLGPAHVRDSGRRTPRGAVIWRAANGSKPDPSYLTPAEAEDALQRLLASALREPTDPSKRRRQGHTFGEACEAWLTYVAEEIDRRPSTITDYRNTVRRYLIGEFGANTLLHTIDTARVDLFRERMLAEGQLSRRTVQKILVLLHGILKRAKRKGWVATNPAEDAERVTVRRTESSTCSPPRRYTRSHAWSPPSSSRRSMSPPRSRGCGWGELRALR